MSKEFIEAEMKLFHDQCKVSEQLAYSFFINAVRYLTRKLSIKLCCVADLYHFANLCVKVASSAFDCCLIYAKMTKEQNYVRIYLILQMKPF